MLVLKTVIYTGKLLDFQNFASLVLELSSSDTRLYGYNWLGRRMQEQLAVFPRFTGYSRNTVNRDFLPGFANLVGIDAFFGSAFVMPTVNLLKFQV